MRRRTGRIHHSPTTGVRTTTVVSRLRSLDLWPCRSLKSALNYPGAVTMPVPEPYTPPPPQYDTSQSAPWGGYGQGPAFPVPDRAGQWPGGFAPPFPAAPHPQPKMTMPIPNPAPMSMPLPALSSDYANFPSPSSASSTYSGSSSPTMPYRGYH